MSDRTFGVIGSVEMDPTLLLDSTPVPVSRPGTGTSVVEGTVDGRRVVIVVRSGSDRPLAPGAIPFRENIVALKECGVTDVLSTGMVGALRSDLPVGGLVVLDQFIDFTRHRAPTLFSDTVFGLADLTNPFCARLRQAWIRAAEELGIKVFDGGCYVCVDGPRFETAAEVRMFARLGGDVIGHTLLPECVMAREAGLCYSMLAGVVNLGAGLSSRPLLARDFRPPRSLNFEAMHKMIRRISTNQLPRLGCQCPSAPMEEQEHASTETP
jgi:5'-methylthioadenosine phosphorylase